LNQSRDPRSAGLFARGASQRGTHTGTSCLIRNWGWLHPIAARGGPATQDRLGSWVFSNEVPRERGMHGCPANAKGVMGGSFTSAAAIIWALRARERLSARTTRPSVQARNAKTAIGGTDYSIESVLKVGVTRKNSSPVVKYLRHRRGFATPINGEPHLEHVPVVLRGTWGLTCRRTETPAGDPGPQKFDSGR